MQLYILSKCPEKSARMLPAKLNNNNYAQKMLIELGQCLSNLMGNKAVDKRLYEYKAVPPQFISFIFNNREWTSLYYESLLQHCKSIYSNFEAKQTFTNAVYISNKFGKTFCQDYIYKSLTHAWFVPQKEYGERKYLPINECIAEYKKYLEWKAGK